jgi:WD40 repeat protein
LIDTFLDFSNEIIIKLCSLDNGYLAVGTMSRSTKVNKLIRILNSDTGGLFIKLKGHTADVYALARLENLTLASGSADKTVKIWHWKSGLLLKNLSGHSRPVNDVIALTDNRIASCANSIRIWNIKTGQLLKTLKTNFEQVKEILLLNNRLHLASFLDEDKTITIWNATSGQKMANLIGHTRAVLCMCNLNESHLASGYRDMTVRLWNHQKGHLVKTLWGHGSEVYSLVLLFNGHLASASDDLTIRIWAIKDTFKQIKVLFGHENSVKCLTVLTNGNLASGSYDEKINIWYFSNNSDYSSNSTICIPL